jgi:hypothetical protein
MNNWSAKKMVTAMLSNIKKMNLNDSIISKDIFQLNLEIKWKITLFQNLFPAVIQLF